MTPEEIHQQHAQQPAQPPKLGDIVAQHIAHRVGLRITNGLENVFWGGCDMASDAYRWAFPLTADHMRRMAIFTRRELDTFVREATKQGRQYIVVQPHRLSDAIRAQYVRDGYTVSAQSIKGEEHIKIAWGGEPVIRPPAARCDVVPPGPM